MQEVYFGFLDPTTSKGLYAVITNCAREATKDIYLLEIFSWKTIALYVQLIDLKDHLEVCLPCSRLLSGHSKLLDNQNLRWSSMKMTLHTYQLSPTLIFEGKTKQYIDGFPKKRENQDQSKNAKSVSTL